MQGKKGEMMVSKQRLDLEKQTEPDHPRLPAKQEEKRDL